MISIGFDISTSIVGIAVVGKEDSKIRYKHLTHCDLKKCNSFWEKVDVMRQFLIDLHSKYESVDIIAVEEALLGFRTGASSAQTITTLVAFNAVVRHMIRDLWNKEPVCIPSQTARKKAGIKVMSKKKCGIDVKQQVFNHMKEHDLSDVIWKTKKNGQPVDHAKDITDAYVIGYASIV